MGVTRRNTCWVVVCWMWFGGGTLLIARQSSPANAQDAVPAREAPTVREVGGRLVATDEIVVVTGESDESQRNSSVATKIETPLLETPRSISIVDRRTLDDLAVINVTQAHDYTVGMTPQDERGPAFARGFPVDFYDLRRDGLRTYSWSVREPVALDRIQYFARTGVRALRRRQPGRADRISSSRNRCPCKASRSAPALAAWDSGA